MRVDLVGGEQLIRPVEGRATPASIVLQIAGVAPAMWVGAQVSIRHLATNERARADAGADAVRLYWRQMNYAKYCGPRRSVKPLAAGELPPLGAHLITPWLGYTHHGIHVGEGRVVQYGALKYDFIRKPVEEVTIDSFAEGRAVFVVTHAEECFDAAKAIARARSRLGERQYRLLTNNCEHFVEWCLHDEQRSFEVETALNFPRWFGERILCALLRIANVELRGHMATIARDTAAKGVPIDPEVRQAPALVPWSFFRRRQ